VYFDIYFGIHLTMNDSLLIWSRGGSRYGLFSFSEQMVYDIDNFITNQSMGNNIVQLKARQYKKSI
jgi:hypothetical protein